MARVGGAFPLPIAQVAEGGFKIELPTGGFYYPGPNEGLVVCGANTVFEYFDPIAQGWRTLYAAGQGGFASVDGFNFRFHNTTGCVTATAVTGAGSAATTNGIGTAATGVTAAVSAGSGATIPATVQPVIGGSVQAPTITQAGSLFLVPPLIVIDPPPSGGTQATAVAALTASPGGISSITMVNVGAGYTASPNFWIIPQANQYQGGPEIGVAAGALPAPGLVYPGNAVAGNQNTSPTGAQLTSNALTGSGTLTDLKLIYPGNGYTGTPTISFSGGGLTSATATVTVGNTTPANDLSFFLPRVQ
jgi:hypothetical protein